MKTELEAVGEATAEEQDCCITVLSCAHAFQSQW